jgi:cyclopropane-fatty-acyl-phospholipid synthase
MLDSILETNLVPDFILRFGINRICKQRLDGEMLNWITTGSTTNKQDFIKSLYSAPIALVPEKANEQHYEVPAAFYDLCLGKRKKYSSCFYPDNCNSLDEAEEHMLSLYIQRGLIQDGQSILELGCGWGSLSLFLAERFPNCKITGVSNSSSQREYILNKASSLGLKNISIQTCDMNKFEPGQKFDRIVSVEMFEHMRNWPELFGKVANWLNDDGKFFMHIFTHKNFAYPYEVKDSTDWMAKYFFSGGMMPSDDLPLYFQEKLRIEDHWMLSGTHYEKTARHWLENLDSNQAKALSVLDSIYGSGEGQKWLVRWRLFFMACEVLFGYEQGCQWGVSHYRFAKRS